MCAHFGAQKKEENWSQEERRKQLKKAHEKEAQGRKLNQGKPVFYPQYCLYDMLAVCALQYLFYQ